jgi:pimeloyl-ACP methyl ester carboxylesterase
MSNELVVGARDQLGEALLILMASLRKALCALVLVGSRVLAAEVAGPGADQHPSGYLDVGGSKIFYEMRGSGPAIILLHDGLLSAVTWDEVWEPLATKHQVIRYDRRGYGRSEPATASFSPTDDLAKLLHHLKVAHAVIVGSSSGAALAIDFAIVHPEMVDGLFLVGPVVHGLEYSAEFRERANRNNEPMKRDEVKAWARNWAQDKFLIAGANEKARKKVYEQLVANAEKLKEYDGSLEAKLSSPANKRLDQIKTPTLILVGEGDIADVQTHARAINDGIRGSEMFVAKGAGHLVQLEKPDDVMRKLKQFAERCAAAPQTPR